ncbi:hypothetical protein Tco_1009527, partial [Tanacetum coccineum]
MNESWKLWSNGDGGACKVLEWLLGDVMEVLGCLLEGASFTQGTVSSIPIVGSISPEGFLPPILLLVVIIVTVESSSIVKLSFIGLWTILLYQESLKFEPGVFLSLEFGLLVLAIFAVYASRAVAILYGYCKNLKKTVKTGQTRARERKSTQRAGRMLSKVNSGQLKSTFSQT